MNPAPSDLLAELLREGAIDVTAAARLAAKRDAARPRLAHILRKHGTLSASQLLVLFQEQGRTPELRIGELAVRAGMCTPEQVEAGLAEQREREPHVLDLIEPGDIADQERFVAVVARYVLALERELALARSR